MLWKYFFNLYREITFKAIRGGGKSKHLSRDVGRFENLGSDLPKSRGALPLTTPLPPSSLTVKESLLFNIVLKIIILFYIPAYE